MEYIKLGNTGLDVSRICLGCMSFGDGTKGDFPWALDEERSRVMIKRALDLGINFFDTSNVYSAGTSEEFTGKILKEYANRDEIVIASKVFYPVGEGPNSAGLSRKHIMSQIDKTLKRLGTDYIDIYYIHRWDDKTPIEETMEALHDLVKSGKVRYIGASTLYAWQFLKAQHVAEKNGWTKFVVLQDHYNLMYREEEREMLELCKADKIGVVPWSPLAAGKLTRPWGELDERAKVDVIAKAIYSSTEDADKETVSRVQKLAEKRGVSMAQIALAWLLNKDVVTAPVFGATEISHIEDAVAAISIKLTEEEMKYLEEAYVPHPVMGITF